MIRFSDTTVYSSGPRAEGRVSLSEVTTITSSEQQHSRRWWTVVVLISFSCSVGGGWFVAMQQNDPDDVGSSNLVVDESNFHFGTVYAQTEFKYPFQLKNKTSEDIAVSLRASCNCTSIDPGSLTVPSHGQATVRLTMNLLGPNVTGSHALEQPFFVNVKARELSPQQRAWEWRVHRRVRRALELSAQTVRFPRGELVVGNSFPTQMIRVVGHEPLRELRADVEGHIVAVSAVRLNDREFEATIAPNESLDAGRYATEVLFRGLTEQGTILPPLPLDVVIPVVDDVEVAPSEVILGAIPIGTKTERVVAFRSRSGLPFAITDVSEPAGDSVRVTPLSKDPLQGTQLYRVLTCPCEPGDQKETVAFHIRAGASDTSYCSRLIVRYYGVTSSKRQDRQLDVEVPLHPEKSRIEKN